MILIENIIFRTILYMVDGAAWAFSIMAIVTGFFGFVAKDKKKSEKHFLIVSVVYMLLNVAIYIIATLNNYEAGVTNGVMVIFAIFYWMFNLQNVKKLKAFFVGLFAAEIVEVICIWVSSLVSIIRMQFDTAPRILDLTIVTLTPIAWTGICILMAKISSRKRKEPMEFSLILTTFVIFVLIETFADFFGVEEYADVEPIVKINFELKDGSELSNSSFVAIIFVCIVIFIVMAIAIAMVIKDSESSYFRKKNTISEYYLELQRNHYESLSESNREIRKIKHDMKNHIYVMRELHAKKNYEELGKYLDEVGENLELADSSIHVGNEIADAIISEKSEKAKALGIEFVVDGNMPFSDISAIDICTIFSNALDNAIEAVKQLPDEKKKIELNVTSNKNFILITEKNPTDGNVKIQDNLIATTKGDKKNHGFGLINIREAAEKYGGDINISLNEDEFSIEIMIPM